MISSTASRAASFAEILDDIALAEAGRASSSFARGLDASGQDWLFSRLGEKAPPPETAETAARATFAYGDLMPEEAQGADEPNFDLDETRIAAELGLAEAGSAADLNQARRAFALRNHPDRWPLALREKANARMQVANMLLDRRRREIASER